MVSTVSPSRRHETLVDMFRERPVLAAEILRGPLQYVVPAFDKAHLSSGELTNVAPTEFHADAVVTLDNAGGPATQFTIWATSGPHAVRGWSVFVVEGDRHHDHEPRRQGRLGRDRQGT